MRRVVAVLIIVSFMACMNAYAMSKNTPLTNLGTGLDNVTYGSVEVPDNISETKSKGTKAFSDCTDATKDDVGRGIVRVVGGLWKIATFWYPTD
jgi:hypothetical protein